MIHYKNNPGVTTVYKVSNNPERVGVGGCLQRKFRGHWIRRRSPVKWPAKNPELITLESYLWGHVKALIYVEKISDQYTIARVRNGHM
jgi:hypothetical protein